MTRQSLTVRQNAKKRDEVYDAYINSIDLPLPENPFKELRLELNLTVQGLADLIGISKQTLIRTEQALFDQPPKNVLDYWVLNGENEYHLTQAYENYQIEMRSRHRRMFGKIDSITFQEVSQGIHPLNVLLNQWTTGEVMNVTQLAKLLCISQPLVSQWMRNKSQVKVPAPLLRALFVSGYSEAELDIFVEAYRVWRLLND